MNPRPNCPIFSGESDFVPAPVLIMKIEFIDCYLGAAQGQKKVHRFFFIIFYTVDCIEYVFYIVDCISRLYTSIK